MNIEFAMRDGCLTHVSEVERGLKCGCVCVCCGDRLVARKGSKKSHHFAHRGPECAYGLETVLHLMAKSILEKEKRILLPAVKLVGVYCRPVLYESQIIEFDEITLEKRLGGMVPDVLVRVGKRLLMVEIWVTHKIDAVKRKKIEDLGISTLEINLSGLKATPSVQELKQLLFEDVACKRWVYNNKSSFYTNKWLAGCEVKRAVFRGGALCVDNCPVNARVWHGNSYAHVVNDCTRCRFLIKYKQDVTAVGGEFYSDATLIYCGGRLGVSSVEELKVYASRAV